jgi:para-nitrobenzyl esterase
MFGGISFRGLKAGEEQGLALQKKLNAASLADMRALPADSILNASGGMGGLSFAPLMDGKFLPADPVKAFSEGNFNSVNLMAGWVTGDGALMGPTKTNTDGFIKSVNERFGAKAEKVLSLLPHSTEAEATASLGNLSLVNFAIASAYRLAAFNRKPSYVYEFSHVPTDKPGFPNYGAFHTSEVPFAMHNLHTWIRPWKDMDFAVENTMSAYWVNFIKTGDPNGAGLPKWESFNTGKIQEIGDATESRTAIYKDLVDVIYK